MVNASDKSGRKKAVIALGGNAISMRDKPDTIGNQFDNTYASFGSIIELIRHDYQLAITHGNGPQVGNALLRVELSRGKVPILPLYICVADLQGGMGYMIEQCLHNRLEDEKIDRRVVALVTQVLVDENDPDFENPTKFIGQFYRKDIALKMAQEMGWQKVKQFPGDSRWRRVVASPKPIRIIERLTVKSLVEHDTIVVAAGGGGIPVIKKGEKLFGVDAVIDKDRGAAVLARDIEAELLIILTDVEKVAINYKQPNERYLDEVTLNEIVKYHQAGHFAAGSMGPKIEAAINFIRDGGKMVIITSIEKGYESVTGSAGTRIIRD